MPRSHGVLKVEIWEAASDYRRLPLDAQWTFAMLVSQPQINNLGVLPFTPHRWVRFACDIDPARLHRALTELEQQRYTITDETTGELLVRTFIRHDAVWKQPKLVTNARRLLRETESDTIRGYLEERHPWLVDESWTSAAIAKHESRRRAPETPSETPSDTPIAEPVENQAEKPLPEGVSAPRAHAQDALPLPLGQPQPVAEGPTAAAATTRDDDEADAAASLRDRLTTIGIAPVTAEQLLVRPALVAAWLDLAASEARDNPAGFVLAGIATGEPPSPRANGQPKTDYAAKARELYQRTGDTEAVADWLAGLTRLTPTDREHILATLET